jgi:rare lipoprotein A
MTRIVALVSLATLLAFAIALVGCSSSVDRQSPVRIREPLPPGTVLRGMASWYGPGFAGRQTANGETFDPRAFTAAHQHLPFHTWVRVTNVRTRASIDVRINDHFPGTRGRVIDLSQGAFERIAPLQQGVVEVEVEVLAGAP